MRFPPLVNGIFALLMACGAGLAQSPATFTIQGDWDVRVSLPGGAVRTVRVTPPVLVQVSGEKCNSVPLFNPKAGGWAKGAQLLGVKAQEATSRNLLDPESFELRAGPEADSTLFTPGTDYELDRGWGTFGRLEGSRIGPEQAVYASYRHGLMRVDSVVLTGDGRIVLRQGIARAAAPAAPTPESGEQLLGNVYLPGFSIKLTEDNVFPVLEAVYPEKPASPSATVTRLRRRLEAGETLRILAWGDSVTDAAYLKAAYLPNQQTERWQEQFVARLRTRFPKARIELLTQAWGGRNTGAYLAEPAGSPHNFRETVLGVQPDLVISEFVNDAGLKPAQVEERYAGLLANFRAIGAEWIVLTPHYVRPDWMELTRERNIDDDPRPYVAGLREFAAKHDVGLADASLRWGRLWRQGTPYSTLLVNAINHPNAAGMRLYADALIALF